MENEKAHNKLQELIYTVCYLGDDWNEQKPVLKYLIQSHINNSYMIDQRYYMEYINLYHDMLIKLNEL